MLIVVLESDVLVRARLPRLSQCVGRCAGQRRTRTLVRLFPSPIES
jgi:hypothetical protein